MTGRKRRDRPASSKGCESPTWKVHHRSPCLSRRGRGRGGARASARATGLGHDAKAVCAEVEDRAFGAGPVDRRVVGNAPHCGEKEVYHV